MGPRSSLPPPCRCFRDAGTHLAWHKTSVWATKACQELNKASNSVGHPLAEGGSSGGEGKLEVPLPALLGRTRERDLAANVVGVGGKREAEGCMSDEGPGCKVQVSSGSSVSWEAAPEVQHPPKPMPRVSLWALALPVTESQLCHRAGCRFGNSKCCLSGFF